MTSLQDCLRRKAFVCVLESLPKACEKTTETLKAIMRRGALAGMPLVVALADRVTADALDPIAASKQLDQPNLSLIHFSGKARSEVELVNQLEQMQALGTEQLLLLSGDRLPGHQPKLNTVRYLESVCALLIAREHCPNWLLGAALNPFKYCEEDGAAQYLKGRKKLHAGADFLTLQLGFDPEKQLEALQWMRQQTTPKPMLACVMAINAKRINFLKQVPGVVVSPSLEGFLAAEAQTDVKQAHSASVQRLALHILGLKLMGFAGIHLSGIHSLQPFLELEAALSDWQQSIHTLSDWQLAWTQIWQDKSAKPMCFKPPQHHWQLGQLAVKASTTEHLRYRLFDYSHRTVFNQNNPVGRSLGWLLKRPYWHRPRPANWLHQLERSIKRPLVGCDSCGTCRLDKTLYVCPETCPKGLANGPCGGTQLNRCEFSDRECIHSVKYRIAKTAEQLFVLETTLIATVAESSRGSSSWPRWFNSKPSNPDSN